MHVSLLKNSCLLSILPRLFMQVMVVMPVLKSISLVAVRILSVILSMKQTIFLKVGVFSVTPILVMPVKSIVIRSLFC